VVVVFGGEPEVIGNGFIAAVLVAGASAKLCALEGARLLEGCADLGLPRYAALADPLLALSSLINMLLFTMVQLGYIVSCLIGMSPRSVVAPVAFAFFFCASLAQLTVGALWADELRCERCFASTANRSALGVMCVRCLVCVLLCSLLAALFVLSFGMI